MFCKWCDGPIPEVIDGKRSTQRYWHPSCVRQFELHTKLTAQRDFVIGRDGEKCAICGEAPMRWLAGEVIKCHRQNCFGYGKPGGEWADVYWDRPEGSWLTMSPEDRASGEHQEITRVSALELDHRVPLWSVVDLPDDERRWYFGPGNLWLLCPKHHKQKTAREAMQRAAERAFVKAQLALPLS